MRNQSKTLTKNVTKHSPKEKVTSSFFNVSYIRLQISTAITDTKKPVGMSKAHQTTYRLNNDHFFKTSRKKSINLKVLTVDLLCREKKSK